MKVLANNIWDKLGVKHSYDEPQGLTPALMGGLRYIRTGDDATAMRLLLTERLAGLQYEMAQMAREIHMHPNGERQITRYEAAGIMNDVRLCEDHAGQMLLEILALVGEDVATEYFAKWMQEIQTPVDSADIRTHLHAAIHLTNLAHSEPDLNILIERMFEHAVSLQRSANFYRTRECAFV